MLVEEEYKFIEEQILKFDDGDFIDNKDAHIFKDPNLLLGGSNKLVDEFSLSSPTQDGDYEISSEVVYSFHGDWLNQDFKMNSFQSEEIDTRVSP